MQRIFRLVRSTAVVGALMSCWLVGGAAQEQPTSKTVNPMAQRLGVSEYVAQDLAINAAEPTRQITTELTLAGRAQRLVMQRYSLRAENMLLLEQLGDGTLRYINPPAVRTYRGTVEDQPDSLVAASLTPDGGLSGMVRIGSETWGFQPMREFDPAAPANRHAVYRQQDLVFPKGMCGTIAPPDRAPAQAEGGVAGSGISGGVQADIAFDAVGSSRVDLQACKLEYSIVSPK